MKISNLVLVFIIIAGCFGLVLFINIDRTNEAYTYNTQYANKLTAACKSAAQTMMTDNIDKEGCVWTNTDELNKTLDAFYYSLTYSFNMENASRESEMALYTPVVCLIDTNGYYISHNVVFDLTGNIESIPTDTEKRNGLTSLNTWTKKYGNIILRYYLNDNVEVYTSDGKSYFGNRNDVFLKLQDVYPGAADLNAIAFITDNDEFNQRKNELIVRLINKECEYYINRHNIVGDGYETMYSFEMPEIKGEDWSRLLENPTVISFLQGYTAQASNKMLNIYALAGGELVKNYHYFTIMNATDPANPFLEYHCLESTCNGHITEEDNPVTTQYESEGVTKTMITHYKVYKYDGIEITNMYSTQSECAEIGAFPHKCVYDWR